jgi:hypothetical protein
MADNATTGTTGTAATGWSPDNGGLPATAKSAAGTATALAQTAQEYVQEYAGKVSDAASQAKDYVTKSRRSTLLNSPATPRNTRGRIPVKPS